MLIAWIRFSTRLAKSAKEIATTAPRGGEQFRGEKIMIVARVRMQERAVKIHHRGRAERVQFRSAGGHRGAENHRDEQADDAVRQIVQDKGDEDIIGVVRFELRIGVFQRFFHFAADRLDLFLLACRTALVAALIASAERPIRAHSLGHAAPVCFCAKTLIVTSLQSGELARLLALCRALVSGLVEKDRRLFELEENENHHPGEEDEELHRQLEHGIEKETEAAAGERTAGEIALDLRLVGPEIGEREKESAEQARPKSVALLRDRRRNRPRSACPFSRRRTPLRETTVRRQPMHDHSEGDAHPGQDDGHLPFIACG